MADTPDPRKPPRQAPGPTPPTQRAKVIPPSAEPPIAPPPVKSVAKPTIAPGKPVVRAVEPPVVKAKRAAPGSVPVGKLVTPTSVAPPPPPGEIGDFGSTSFSSSPANQSGMHRVRRKKGTPVAVWAVIGIGVLAVGGLAAFLMTRGDKDDTVAKADKAHSKESGKNEKASDKKPADDPSSIDKHAAKSGENDAKPESANPKDAPEKNPKAPAEKTPADNPRGKSPDKPETPVTPPPESTPAVNVKSFRGIEEVAVGERAAALDNLINDSLALLKENKFDEFFQKHVDPRDRGATPPAVARRTKNQSPYDVLNQGSEKIAAILAGIGERKPHLLEDGKIAVFDLSSRTRPTFVEHEGQWYLSRGVKTHMTQRFPPLTDQQEIIYLLETSSGKPAVGPADAKREGSEQGIIEELVQKGAYVALSHPDEEFRCSGVMLTDKFKGGDEGLKLLGKLNEISQMRVLIVDGMAGSNITEEVGFMEFDGLTYLEYFQFTNMPPLQHPVTVHCTEMGKLKTLILDGGDLVSDAQIGDHLFRAVELKRLSLKGNRIGDSTLERLKIFTRLESLELDVPPGSVTPAGIADLRGSKEGLWIDH